MLTYHGSGNFTGSLTVEITVPYADIPGMVYRGPEKDGVLYIQTEVCAPDGYEMFPGVPAPNGSSAEGTIKLNKIGDNSATFYMRRSGTTNAYKRTVTVNISPVPLTSSFITYGPFKQNIYSVDGTTINYNDSAESSFADPVFVSAAIGSESFELVAGEHYTVSNDLPAGCLVAGHTYNITLTGKGTFTGTKNIPVSVEAPYLQFSEDNESWGGNKEKYGTEVYIKAYDADKYDIATEENGTYDSVIHIDSAIETDSLDIFLKVKSGSNIGRIISTTAKLAVGRNINDEKVEVTIDSSVAYTPEGSEETFIDYTKIADITDYSAAVSVKYEGDTSPLVNDTHYTLTAPTITEPVSVTEDGTTYYLTIKGKPEGGFIGERKIGVVVPERKLKFDGAEKTEDSFYLNKVEITVDEDLASYDISKTPGNFGSSLVYDTAGENQTVEVYIRDNTTSRVSKQTITGLTVVKPELLFNGKPQMASYYMTSVELSAAGYRIVGYTDGSGTVEFAPVATYTWDTTSEDPQNFKLLLIHNSQEATATPTEVDVTGLCVYDDADLPIRYNGKPDREEWFASDVSITANGFDIAEYGTTAFRRNYLVKDEGKHLVSLTFRNVGTLETKDILDIEIKIDKTAPSGKIKIGEFGTTSFASNDDLAASFKEPEEITLSGEDAFSGVNYIRYFISDTYYEDVAALKAAVPPTSDSTQWKTYSDESKPTLEANKKNYIYAIIYDKAGNSTFISSGRIACSTAEATGQIKIGKYTSKKFQTSDTEALYTNKPQKVAITASSEGMEVEKIEYYISDTYYSSPEEVEGGIKEKNSGWKTYVDSTQPQTTLKDKKNYVYARITDGAGNYTYLSTGYVCYDTVAPKLTTYKAVRSDSGTGATVAYAGSDDLSGINRFKIVVREKTSDNMTPPDKNYMMDMGGFIEVSSSEGKEAVASYEVKNLEAGKAYMLYFAAVDRAGNISSVKQQELKVGSGSDSSNGSVRGGNGGSGSGSGGNGLTPAPNGIAGSGSGSSPKTPGAASLGTPAGQSTADRIEGTVINREPYIAEATGNIKIGEIETAGWNRISREVRVADKGTLLEVEMSGTSNVSGDLFSAMKDRDVTTRLRMAEGIKWELTSADVANAAASDIDLGVRLGSKAIPSGVINQLSGSYPHVEFSISHEGDFGFTATIIVPVGETNKGKYATLYHYDGEAKTATVEGNTTIDDLGYARFPMTHASEYIVVITADKLLSSPVDANADAAADDTAALANDTARLRLTDIFTFRGSVRAWLFFIAFLSAAACLIILFLPQLQRKDDSGDTY